MEGLIEFEAAHTRTRFSDPAKADEEENDLDLATVELAMDAAISDHVDGHVLFKYEE
ncbi:MAG: hypothetical protein U5K27_02165 [Desulfotignum sp.]|nr:hypothetical protein [Desulfotignum sp.]